MEWSKMNVLFIYTCTNFAQILTFCLYIKIGNLQTYKAKCYKIKKQKALSNDSSTLFHMPFKDHIPDLSQIIT